MFIRKLVILISLSLPVWSQTVVTTLPEFAWAVRELAPNLTVKSLLNGTEDPHFVDASPSFVFKVASADLVIFNGLALEIGWFPKVVELSGNSKVQLGAQGYCNASTQVTKMGQLANYDRSMGDVHPQGNPHYTMSIPRMIESVESIKDCLIKIGLKKVDIEEKYKDLKNKMLKTYKKLQQTVKPEKYYVFHREFNYLEKDFGFKFMKSLEKVPGVLPSATYLSRLAMDSKVDKPKKVLASNTSSEKILKKFKELSQVDYIKIKLHPAPGEDYIEFIKETIENISK